MGDSLFPAAAHVTFRNMEVLNFYIMRQALSSTFRLALQATWDKYNLISPQQLFKGVKSALTSSPVFASLG